MADNYLENGQTRLGWLYDNDERTELTACTLSRAEDRIMLTVPWQGFASPYERWFGGSAGVAYGDDPDKSKYNYAPPSPMWFSDVHGTVTLLDCASRGHTISRVGQGNIQVGRAIFGGSSAATYLSINSMRSRVVGMSQWMNLRSLSYEFRLSSEKKIDTVDFHLKSPPPVKIARQLNLKIVPSFGYTISAHGDTSEVREMLYIETSRKIPADWTEHIRLHTLMERLVAVAAWKPFTSAEQLVRSDKDPERVLTGDSIGPRWARVLSGYPQRSTFEPKGSIDFLFRFDDIKPRGISKWIRLYEKFERGFLPILDNIYSTGLTLDTQVSQASIGLDGIGYVLARDAGLSARAAGNESHANRLRRVYGEVRTQLPFESEPWATDSKDAYNSVKHTNLSPATFRELFETRRKHHLLFRVWIAEKLGQQRDVLQERVNRDVMARPLEGG